MFTFKKKKKRSFQPKVWQPAQQCSCSGARRPSVWGFPDPRCPPPPSLENVLSSLAGRSPLRRDAGKSDLASLPLSASPSARDKTTQRSPAGVLHQRPGPELRHQPRLHRDADKGPGSGEGRRLACTEPSGLDRTAHHSRPTPPSPSPTSAPWRGRVLTT